MYISIVTICELVGIFMYLTRNCTVYVNIIYVLFYIAQQTGLCPVYMVGNPEDSFFSCRVPFYSSKHFMFKF